MPQFAANAFLRALAGQLIVRVFHRAWPDLQRMKLPLPVARSYRVSFFLVFHRAWPDLQRMKLLLPVARSCRVSFLLVFHRAWPDLQRMKLLLPVARSCRVSFFLVFHRAWPDLQRMKLLLPGGAVLPGQFPPSSPKGYAKGASPGVARYRVTLVAALMRPNLKPS